MTLVRVINAPGVRTTLNSCRHVWSKTSSRSISQGLDICRHEWQRVVPLAQDEAKSNTMSICRRTMRFGIAWPHSSPKNRWVDPLIETLKSMMRITFSRALGLRSECNAYIDFSVSWPRPPVVEDARYKCRSIVLGRTNSSPRACSSVYQSWLDCPPQ
jgi:hypothetical protein